MKVLTKALIQKSEESAVKSGVFSFREMMYRAGSTAADIIMKKHNIAGKKITVVCGKGNNGGDGCIIADILSGHGAQVTVYTPFGAPVTENALYYFNLLKNVKVTDTYTFGGEDIIIDALYGIGFKNTPDPVSEKIINEINGVNALRIAIDVPSGAVTDSGEVPTVCVDADLTVTFIALKPCFLLPPASDYCGETVIADIGVSAAGYSYLTIEPPVFKKRRHNSHKGTFGTALLFCGSYGMAGALMLSARGALRSGAGLVKCVLCDSIYSAFTSAVPEAVCIPVKQSEYGTLSPENIDVKSALNGADAVLIGCGLGNNPDTERLAETVLLNTKVPAVVDADGINVLIHRIDIIKQAKAPVIITPHPGEMARLYGISVKEVEADRIGISRNFAEKYGCTVVLKGADTIVALPSGEIFFCREGNPGMATGGSGDVLAGITVSMLAQGMNPSDAAKAAVYLHACAGDKAAAKRGERAMLPSDIIEEL